MAKYAIFFTYTSEAWARMIQSPGDRTAAVRQLTDSVGGSVECVYWMFGAQDGLVIFDAPDSVGAAALSVAVGTRVPLRAWRPPAALPRAAQPGTFTIQDRGAGLPTTRPAD